MGAAGPCVCTCLPLTRWPPRLESGCCLGPPGTHTQGPREMKRKQLTTEAQQPLPAPPPATTEAAGLSSPHPRGLPEPPQPLAQVHSGGRGTRTAPCAFYKDGVRPAPPAETAHGRLQNHVGEAGRAVPVPAPPSSPSTLGLNLAFLGRPSSPVLLL